MPYDFHEDTDVYFEQQRVNALSSIVPFIERHGRVGEGTRVLEIGCGAGGVVKAFLERGATVTGVDLHAPSIEHARRALEAEIAAGRARILLDDIYDVDIATDLGGRFDVVVMKDTIEHIHDQRRLIGFFDRLLSPSGLAFFAFPPWQMPFGGHQQICRHRAAMRAPYIHLLPRQAYEGLLRRLGEPDETIEALLEIKQTGITIERFEGIVAETGHRVVDRTLFLVNPMYRYRYKLEPREQLAPVAGVPVLRNFVTTSAYYLVSGS